MGFEVKVELYQDKIKTIEEASSRALELTAEAVLTDIKTSQVVPKDNAGTLEDSAFIEVKDMVARIMFDTPYARRLYWHPEYNFQTGFNPNAQGLWMHTYLDGDKKQWVIDTFMQFLKVQAGGLIT